MAEELVFNLERENDELAAALFRSRNARVAAESEVERLRARITAAMSPESVERARAAAWPVIFAPDGDSYSSLLESQRQTVIAILHAALDGDNA